MYEGEVHFISRNDCSMYVSTLLLNGLHRKYPFYNILIAKITNTKNKKVFYSLIKGWNESKNDDNIYFNKKFANSVDLQEKDIVHFDVVDANTLNTLSKVFFKTTPEDYVKMDTCSVKLEDTILNQVRCVCKNSKLPIWINNQIVIFIFIDSLEPSCDFGLLQQDTELHFVPPEPESHKPSINQPQPTTMLGSLVNNYFNLSHMDVSFNEFCNRPMYARVCSLGPQKPGIQKGSKISKNSYCVYLNKKLKSHAKLKSEHSSWPVFAFHQLNFKHESQTDLEFCSQIDELEDVRSYDNDASIISTKNENVSDANTNHCNTKNIKDSHVSSNHKKKDTKNQSTSNGLSVEITNESNTESNNRSNSSEHINENSSIIPRQDQVFADDLDFLEPSEQLILIYLDQQLLSDLNLKVGAKFCLSPYRETYRCQKVILHALMPKDAESKNLPDIDEDIDKDFLVKFFHASYYPILNHNAILSLSVRSMTIPIRVELIPSSVKYCLYDNKIQREVQISYEEYVPVKQKVVQSEGGVLTSNLGAISTEKPFLNHLNQTLNTLVSQIRISVRSSYLYRDNILVTGAEGSGKTTFCKTLQEALQNAGPDSIHCQVVDCKQMKSKIPNVVEKYLRDVLSCACYMEPSCVILDDINILCSCNKESLDVAATTLCNKLCSLFVSLVHEFQLNSSIVMVGVTSSRDIIKNTKAGLVFSHCYSLPPLELDNRNLLLETLIQYKLKREHYNMNDIDINKVSKQCEGYTVQDMCDVVDKALFHYLHTKVDLEDNDASTPDTLKTNLFSTEDLEEAFKSHVPLALKGISSNAVEKINFSNVGGLKSAKQLLIETLVWPSMYPDLFSQCPLKPQSGILLYGAPGTGKTLLASAISGECGLKFISIKGPELFSKFIGESEEGVRNIFNRARSIQPCILFFDEFDSLAAKRGNDSTGVKDRVVNQLLTELDGVEGLEGVYVVGATSRPDIIDPALLRPGRLGSSVHCTMPDLKEREDILSVLTQKLKLNSDVNLTKIAQCTEMFTGADLLGLLCSAQMLRQEYDEESSEEPEITQADLLKALEDTKPSLSAADSFKFEQIFYNFANNRGLSSDEIQKQKVISA